jgi:hypothetical protein
MCKLRALELRFPAEFREWVNNLIRLWSWRKAGYSLEQEGLDFNQWQALSYITRHFEVKDLEAQMGAQAVP